MPPPTSQSNIPTRIFYQDETHRLACFQPSVLPFWASVFAGCLVVRSFCVASCQTAHMRRTRVVMPVTAHAVLASPELIPCPRPSAPAGSNRRHGSHINICPPSSISSLCHYLNMTALLADVKDQAFDYVIIGQCNNDPCHNCFCENSHCSCRGRRSWPNPRWQVERGCRQDRVRSRGRRCPPQRSVHQWVWPTCVFLLD